MVASHIILNVVKSIDTLRSYNCQKDDSVIYTKPWEVDARWIFNNSELKPFANIAWKDTDIILLIWANSGFLNQCKWYTIFDLRWNADIGVMDSNNCTLTPTVDSITGLKCISCFLRKDNMNDLKQSEIFVWSWYEIWKQNSTLAVLMNQRLYTSSSLRRQGKSNMWPSKNSFACVIKRSYHCLQR